MVPRCAGEDDPLARGQVKFLLEWKTTRRAPCWRNRTVRTVVVVPEAGGTNGWTPGLRGEAGPRLAARDGGVGDVPDDGSSVGYCPRITLHVARASVRLARNER